MLHNEDDYPDPLTFKPERFLKDGQLDPNIRDPAMIAFRIWSKVGILLSRGFSYWD